jgi:hypothetical protein
VRISQAFEGPENRELSPSITVFGLKIY